MPKRSYTNHDQALAELEMSSGLVPPRKKARSSNIVVVAATSSNDNSAGVSREDDSERRESADERQDDRQGALCSESVAFMAAAASRTAPTKGIILRSGRIRLPDKLIQYLNNGVAPDSLFWQSDGQGFSIDCEKVQTDLLDKYFHGTKLSSFLRSLNRWGFKRLFYHSMPKTTLSFHHPLFRKDAPDLCKDMNMGPGSVGGIVTQEPKKVVPRPASDAILDVEPASTPPPAAQAVPVPPPPAAIIPAASIPPTQPQNPVAALNIALLAPAPAPPSSLQAVIEQMRAQIAADAANKDRLLRQALAAEQQRVALMAHANNNNQVATNAPNPLSIIESLSSLISAGQPALVATPNAQLVALARALSATPAPTPPAAPVPAPQAPTGGTLLQLLTPAQQLELLSKLTGSK